MPSASVPSTEVDTEYHRPVVPSLALHPWNRKQSHWSGSCSRHFDVLTSAKKRKPFLFAHRVDRTQAAFWVI